MSVCNPFFIEDLGLGCRLFIVTQRSTEQVYTQVVKASDNF